MPRLFDGKLNAEDMIELQTKLKKLKALDRTEVQKSLRGGALLITRDIKKTLSDKIYSKPVPTYKNGKPKYLRSGNLRNLVQTEVNPNAGKVIIMSLADYSGFIEFGTSKMKAKEFFFENVNKGVKRIAEEINNKIGNILK